mmetsp:Transcript_118015/g.338524  ORF Transcript_118015/g.338524 Transcript_118015/m.338524 type:complete len:462 (+) Transcript_118015:74-1459(+)
MVRPRAHGVITCFALAAFAARTTCRSGFAADAAASVGCHHPHGTSSHSAGKVAEWRSLPVDDFETVERRFWLVAPASLRRQPPVPAPLLLAFHGQGSDAWDFSAKMRFGELGEGAGLFVAYPQGMRDGPVGAGWNDGTAGDGTTCTGEVEPGQTACYQSCDRLGACGRCNWATCYDDRLFSESLLRALFDEFCIDTSRVYLVGESNGGTLIHHLVHEMPGTFAAFATFYALPLLGYAAGARGQALRHSAALRSTALLQLSAREDTIIPVSGGVSSQGWIYEPRAKVQALWAGLHGCASPSGPARLNWSAGPSSIVCDEYPRCETGRRIMSCTYEGNHGDRPSGDEGQKLTLWFLLQFSREGVSSQARVAPLRPLNADSRGVLVVLDAWSFAALVVFVVLGASLGGAVLHAIVTQEWSLPLVHDDDLDKYEHLGHTFGSVAKPFGGAVWGHAWHVRDYTGDL